MLFLKKKNTERSVRLFNTASKEKEIFRPLHEGRVKLYSCGPTVYDYIHIGNLRPVVLSDTVRRTFEYAKYRVLQVMNITDVGHLSSDADEGEDKMLIALKREGREVTIENMLALADVYAEAFTEDLHALNAEVPYAMPRASEHIRGMEAYIETLLHKGYAYPTSDGIYFETAKFPRYGVLGGSASETYSRTGVSGEKKNPRDFALWKFDTTFGWDAPWGKGFPGWHIECTAMATHYLGKSFDIHTGGVEHVAVHHNNEIAQAEAANGKPYARYWLHHEHIFLEGKKISKSLGNTVTLSQLSDRGIHPLALRYWLLTGHYRQSMNFTWEAIQAAHTALTRAWRLFADFPNGGTVSGAYLERFEEAIFDDFNTPEAVAVLWSLLKDESVAPKEKKASIRRMDAVLGIGFDGAPSRAEAVSVSVVSRDDIPEEIEKLIEEREEARSQKNFERADQLREKLKQSGYRIEDAPGGPVVKRL